MIKCDLGVINIKGDGAVLCVELESIIRAIYENTKSLIGEDCAKEMIETIVKNAMRPEKEVVEEGKKRAEEHKEEFDAYSKRIKEKIRKEKKESEEKELKELMRKLAKALREEEEDE